jgi:putative oxidoreductase
MKKLVQLFSPLALTRLDALSLLTLRLSFGGAMVYAHGWGKLVNFSSYSERFPDPIGVGPVPSLALAVFSEVFCAIAVVLGLFTRLAAIPLMITMAVAVLIVHAPDPFAKKEMGMLYFFAFFLLFARGAGSFSVDALLDRRR